jgi:hypothetical protein
MRDLTLFSCHTGIDVSKQQLDPSAEYPKWKLPSTVPNHSKGYVNQADVLVFSNVPWGSCSHLSGRGTRAGPRC